MKVEDVLWYSVEDTYRVHDGDDVRRLARQNVLKLYGDRLVRVFYPTVDPDLGVVIVIVLNTYKIKENDEE